MIFDDISIDEHTDFHIIWNRAMTGQRHGDEILRPVIKDYHTIVRYAATTEDDFMLMDYNCRSYSAH